MSYKPTGWATLDLRNAVREELECSWEDIAELSWEDIVELHEEIIRRYWEDFERDNAKGL